MYRSERGHLLIVIMVHKGWRNSRHFSFNSFKAIVLGFVYRLSLNI